MLGAGFATAPAMAEDAGNAGRTDTIRLETTTVTGNRELLRKMLAGEWDDDFVVIEPGSQPVLTDFLKG